MKLRTIFSALIVLINLLCFSQVRIGDSSNYDNKPDSSYNVSKDSLVKIIKQQNADIVDFKNLQEDLTAKNVFEKSKSYLMSWITISGLVILIVTLLGLLKSAIT